MVKKTIYTVLCALLFVVLMAQAAFGANNVSRIDVDAVIDNDGSAYITQTWECEFTEGTEGYIPIENLSGMSISEFRVSDSKGEYTYVENWNINAGFNAKVRKYGIVETGRGYELCWGISQYGENTYTIGYRINDMVGSYTDYDGFNFQFINSGMTTLPTDATVKISTEAGTELNSDNCGIWAFGFHGRIGFKDGYVSAYTEEPLSSDEESVIIMMQLDKGLISPGRTVDKSFESVKAQAFEGSDYDYDKGSAGGSSVQPEDGFRLSDMTPIFAVLGILAALIVFFAARRIKRKKKIRALYMNADYYRQAPIEGNLEANFVLARDFGQADNDKDLIGAAFLQLINAGCLEPMSEKTVGFFGREKESVSLRLVGPPEFAGITANMLYDLLGLACGSDGILQEKELENYCRKNYTSITDIVEAAKRSGEKALAGMKCYDYSKAAKPLGLSKTGEALLMNIMGFKKYLLEFSLIGERTIAESVIWQDYLTFATLFGIAEKAIAQFEKVYPDSTEYIQNAHFYYWLALSYTSSSYEVAQSARSAGTGGMSSFGGGGGFSGGGGGGGAR